MFDTLPEIFRSFGIPADVRTLLLFRKAIEKGLVRTLGDIYNVLKGLLVREPTMMGPFTKAFYFYFLAIDIKDGEKLNNAIQRSETFKDWKSDARNSKFETEDVNEQIEAFLDEVHLTTYDIQTIINRKEIFDKDNPDLADDNAQDNANTKRNLDKLADYSELSLEELLERMRKVEAQQKSKHTGGSHWIGSGGTSPYGNGGAAKNGIRVAGKGGGKMARAVLNDKNYYPVDVDSEINDDTMDAALASLKGIFEESAQEFLDVENTIKEGLKRGGLFLPEIKNVNQQKLQVLLFIDNGGYSMMAYVRTVQKLFKKMKTRFAHDLETFYFHNTIYSHVFSDANRSKKVKIETILKKDANYRIFIIGDASMAEYEITQESITSYQSILNKFKKTVWINPEDEKYWFATPTTRLIGSLIPMFPMTPRGIENAVKEMNKKKNQ
jgi:uncharacterized protein